MNPIRLGVIGLGLIWLRAHRPTLATLGGAVQPVAFCDVSAERRAAMAEAYPGAPVVTDYRELLQMDNLDAVLVLTPIAFNAPTAQAALAAGKDVIMEKPIARSVAEGQQLVTRARQAGRRLFVLEQLAYRQAETTLANLLTSGEIGDVLLWERVFHLEGDSAQGAMRYDTTPWRKAADFPLGTLFDGGIHLIASLSKVFGPPASVSATGKKLRPDYGEYDQVAMLFDYTNGATGMLSHSSYLPPLKNYFYIHGSKGVITVEPNRLLLEKSDQSSRTIDLPAEHPYTVMWQALLAAWQAGCDPSYTPERALQDVAILEMVDRAIKSGQRMAIQPVDGRYRNSDNHSG